MANTIIITKLSNGNVLIDDSVKKYTLPADKAVFEDINEDLVYLEDKGGVRADSYKVSDVEKVVRADSTEITINDLSTLFSELSTFFFFKSSNSGEGGSVESVNLQLPDGNGNVSIGQDNIPSTLGNNNLEEDIAELSALTGEVASENLLVNTNTAVAGGEAQGVPDPTEQIEGWYFKNDSLTSKINWYIPSSANTTMTLADYDTSYALVNLRTLGTGASVFFNVYTKRQNDGNDAGTWYRSRVTYADASLFVGESDTAKLVHTGTNPSSIFPGIDRIQLPIESTEGNGASTEEILVISVATSTVQQEQYIGNTEFVMTNFGMYKGSIRSDYILKSEDNRQVLLSDEDILQPKNNYTAGSDGDTYKIDNPSLNNNYVVITPSEDITGTGITLEGINGANIDGNATFTWNVNREIVLKRSGVGTWETYFTSESSVLTLDTSAKFSNFTASWNTEYSNIGTVIGDITVTLPAPSESNIGKKCRLWLSGDLSSNQVYITTHSDSNSINNIAGIVSHKPIATINPINPLYNLTEIVCVSANSYNVSNVGTISVDGDIVVQPVDNEAFTKHTVDENNTPFTIPDWDSVIELKNGVSDLEVILPSMASSNIGKEVKFWVEHNTANHKITVKAPDTNGVINSISADGSEVAKAEYKDSKPNYFRFTAQLMGENDTNIEDATSVFNTLRYVVNVNNQFDFAGPYSYLQASGVPTNFATNNASWWIAKKLESTVLNDFSIRTLFTTPDYGVGIYGDGTYFGTSGTSGYLQTISPTTVPEAGEWLIYQYDHVNDEYTAWLNGIKVLDASSSGVTPPSSAPSDLIFFNMEPNTGWSAPSGYLYPMKENVKFSNISLGSGLLSDVDAGLFTTSAFDCPTVSGGTLTNQWKFADSDTVTTVTGAINLTLTGTNINTELL